ncbi:NACHT domain-containing NTPase [Microcoleus sp.]|uniref:NACHT domain-containing protein n=1 Tax=Microcoleus sp. TaxID=44472 RepID=UPI003523E9DA
MESWHHWDDFLKIISRDHQLTDAETESFLLQFARQNLGKGLEEIAAQLPPMENPLASHKKRMSEVYGKLSQSWVELKSITHKSRPLLKWLETKYSQWLSDRDSGSSLSSATTDKSIDWRDICGKVLETQQLRRQATAQQYELNIYVPLGLMERPKTPNPRINLTGEESQPQKEPELQIVQTYKDDAFFQKVIAENRTEKRKQIAIIGEPGAGKTTLLGKLVEQLPKNSLDLPICIRLADLQGITIKDYLVNNWLEKAVEHINPVPKSVTPEIIEALKQLFRQSKVWLLLDGVDEMAAESPVLALARIREQLTDWVGKARVVLTCRLNVWDAAISNTLTDFDTYKTLEFEPNDVDQFICQWFEEASQDEKRCNSGNETFWLEQGKRLQQQLKAPGKERIRELVRNPLRLSMLCQSWCVSEQDLPETKAALYEQFTTYFFEWKKEEFQKKYRVLKETDEKQIKQALAKLALAAMESTNRFRIEQEFAIEQMEEQWFDLADQLGWLVLVDRDTRTKKLVYAFFHPTFQEYFAACAIADWYYFLNHVPHNPQQGIYRIFEKQWKEVILLWLGRRDVADEDKERFIEALVNFEDGCGKFYKYRACFLAAAGICEYRHCALTQEIISTVFAWSSSFSSLAEVAKATLLETDRTKAIDWLMKTLVKFVTNKLPYYSDRVADNLLSEIEYVCQKFPAYDYELLDFAEFLGKLDPYNQLGNAILLKILKQESNQISFYYSNNSYLDRLGKQQRLWKAVYTSAQIKITDPEIINLLTSLVKRSDDINLRRAAVVSLNKISKYWPQIIDDLVDWLVLLADPRHGRTVSMEMVWHLCLLGKSDLISSEFVLRAFWFAFNKSYFKITSDISKNIPTTHKQTIIDSLVDSINYSSFIEWEDGICEAAWCLWQVDKSNPLVNNVLINIINKSSKEWGKLKAAEILGSIDVESLLARKTLVEKVINLSKKEKELPGNFLYTQAFNSFVMLGYYNQLNVEDFLNLFGISTTDWYLNEPNEILERISLLKLESKQQHEIIYQVSLHLSEPEQKYVRNYGACRSLLWDCSQNMPYSEFYEAWYSQPITNPIDSTPPTQNLNLANLLSTFSSNIKNLFAKFLNKTPT